MVFDNVWLWIRPLCWVLLWILEFFQSVINNWGLSIIALSVFMRLFTLPVSRYGQKQQNIFREKQAKVKPLIDEINLKYKKDSEKCYRETLKIYKEHNFSPYSSFKGCLWLLVQLPIFIALFQILSHAEAIRGAGFLWIQDLSQPEQLFHLGITIPIIGSWFNFLPMLMFIAQMIQARMMVKDNTSDTGQGNKKWSVGVYILPLSMMILFYQFASGLLLYWTTTNLCQIFEQWVFNRRIALK